MVTATFAREIGAGVGAPPFGNWQVFDSYAVPVQTIAVKRAVQLLRAVFPRS